MNAIEPRDGSRRAGSGDRVYTFALVILSLGAIAATYLLSLYTTDPTTKVGVFSAVVVVFLIACFGAYVWHHGRRVSVIETPPTIDIDERLQVLDEVREFFSGSLKTADSFRLVVSRITDLVPFKAVQLLLLDNERQSFSIAALDGPGMDVGSRLTLDEGVAGACYRERDIAFDTSANSVAVPLKNKAEVFGVLKFDLTDGRTADASALDAIGERVAPLILASIAYERSRSNALTDAGTELPNERAFHLVLENQVAEAIRKGNSRPLTILTVEVADFNDLVASYGHAAGDRVLSFVAERFKESLRQMDLLARGAVDEFLVVMPTASQEISQDIIARMQAAAAGRKLKMSETDAVEIDLVFGWASFGNDGETPHDLIAVARERRAQNRSVGGRSVLWFPQQFVN